MQNFRLVSFKYSSGARNNFGGQECNLEIRTKYRLFFPRGVFLEAKFSRYNPKWQFGNLLSIISIYDLEEGFYLIEVVNLEINLRNKFLNTKSDIDRKAYNKQHNLCVSLIRSEKKNFFSNINTSDITDNKTFWKTVKQFFTDKIKTKSK